jgi:uncharacterized protein YceK
MRIIKTNLLVMLLALLLSGCATMMTETSTRFVSEEAKIAYIKDTGIFHIPVLANLDVSSTKVTGQATERGNYNLQILKVKAVNNAITASNADVLVEPRFTIDADTRSATVSVIGYPATYKNFRNVTENDSLLIKNIEKLLNVQKYIGN